MRKLKCRIKKHQSLQLGVKHSFASRANYVLEIRLDSWGGLWEMSLIYLLFKIINSGVKNPRILRDIWLGLFANAIFSAIHDGFKADIIILLITSVLGMMMAEYKLNGDL